MEMNEYPRLRRLCPNPRCWGQGKARQYLRVAEKGKRGTWRCPTCGQIDPADLNDPKVREFLEK